MPVGSDHIAAPTAAILYQFREVCLLNRDTRVALLNSLNLRGAELTHRQ